MPSESIGEFNPHNFNKKRDNHENGTTQKN